MLSKKLFEITKEINRGELIIIYLIEYKSAVHRMAAKVNHRSDTSILNEFKFMLREIGILMQVEAPTIILIY